LLALAVVTAAALSGVAPFMESGAATTQAAKDRTGWYDTVRETVEILMDSRWAPQRHRREQCDRERAF
jgi:hypothetical protein